MVEPYPVTTCIQIPSSEAAISTVAVADERGSKATQAAKANFMLRSCRQVSRLLSILPAYTERLSAVSRRYRHCWSPGETWDSIRVRIQHLF
jgi:hypothetical protein